MRSFSPSLFGRNKPPRGLATINRAHPIGRNVAACWAFNEGGGGSLVELDSGRHCPITLNGTDSNRCRWNGSTDGIPCLDFREGGSVSGNYARGQNLRRVVYSRGITFLGVFRYPTGGSAGSNRSLLMTRTDGLNGLMWSFSTNTLTVTTKGTGGWNFNTGLVPPRDRIVCFAGCQDTDGSIRMVMNGQRYSNSGTWTVPTISEWYLGIDSFDTSRQWHGQVYLAAVLNRPLTWSEMETWAREPFAFLWGEKTNRSVYTTGGGGGGTGAARHHYVQQGTM